MSKNKFKKKDIHHVLNALGVTHDDWSIEDLFVILGKDAKGVLKVYRVPILDSARIDKCVELSIESKTYMQILRELIPFYNQEQYKVDPHCYLKFLDQPNLAGQLLTRFVSYNVQNVFLSGDGHEHHDHESDGDKELPPEDLHLRTGCWIDLRHFRSVRKPVELEDAVPEALRPLFHKHEIRKVVSEMLGREAPPDFHSAPPSPTTAELAEKVAPNLYVTLWNDLDNPTPGEYSVYYVPYDKYASDAISMDDLPGARSIMEKYFFSTGNQVAALNRAEAEHMGLSNFGLCIVVNVSSFIDWKE